MLGSVFNLKKFSRIHSKLKWLFWKGFTHILKFINFGVGRIHICRNLRLFTENYVIFSLILTLKYTRNVYWSLFLFSNYNMSLKSLIYFWEFYAHHKSHMLQQSTSLQSILSISSSDPSAAGWRRGGLTRDSNQLLQELRQLIPPCVGRGYY